MNLGYYFSQDYLFTVGGPHQFLEYWLIFFSLIFIAGNIIYFLFRRKNNFPATKNLIKQIWYFYMTWGILGLLATFARSENLPTFGSRFFIYLVIVLLAITTLWLLYYFFFKTKKALYDFENRKRKEKWLKKK